jgi:hypothetical protein
MSVPGGKRSAHPFVVRDAGAQRVGHGEKGRGKDATARDVEHLVSPPFLVKTDAPSGCDDELCARSIADDGVGAERGRDL